MLSDGIGVYNGKAHGVYFSLRVTVHLPFGRFVAVCEKGAVMDAPKSITQRIARAYFTAGLLFQIASL